MTEECLFNELSDPSLQLHDDRWHTTTSSGEYISGDLFSNRTQIMVIEKHDGSGSSLQNPKYLIRCDGTRGKFLSIDDFCWNKMCGNCIYQLTDTNSETEYENLLRVYDNERAPRYGLIMPNPLASGPGTRVTSYSSTAFVPKGCPHYIDPLESAVYRVMNKRVHEPYSWKITVKDGKVILSIQFVTLTQTKKRDYVKSSYTYQNFIFDTRNGKSYVTSEHNEKHKKKTDANRTLPDLMEITYSMPDALSGALPSIIDKDREEIVTELERTVTKILGTKDNAFYILADHITEQPKFVANLFMIASLNRFPNAFITFDDIWCNLPTNIKRKIGKLDRDATITSIAEKFGVKSSMIGNETVDDILRKNIGSIIIANETCPRDYKTLDDMIKTGQHIRKLAAKANMLLSPSRLCCRNCFDIMKIAAPIIAADNSHNDEYYAELICAIDKNLSIGGKIHISNHNENTGTQAFVLNTTENYDNYAIDFIDNIDYIDRLTKTFSRNKHEFIVTFTINYRQHFRDIITRARIGEKNASTRDDIQLEIKSRYDIDSRRLTRKKQKELTETINSLISSRSSKTIQDRKKSIEEANKILEDISSNRKNVETYISHIDESNLNDSMISAIVAFMQKNNIGISPYASGSAFYAKQKNDLIAAKSKAYKNAQQKRKQKKAEE